MMNVVEQGRSCETAPERPRRSHGKECGVSTLRDPEAAKADEGPGNKGYLGTVPVVLNDRGGGISPRTLKHRRQALRQTRSAEREPRPVRLALVERGSNLRPESCPSTGEGRLAVPRRGGTRGTVTTWTHLLAHERHDPGRATVQAEEGPHRFSVDLPTGWQQASHVRLVLRGVTVAGDNRSNCERLRSSKERSLSYWARRASWGSVGRIGSTTPADPADRCDATPQCVGRSPCYATDHHDPHRSRRWPQCAGRGSTGQRKQSGWKGRAAAQRRDGLRAGRSPARHDRRMLRRPT